MSLLLLAEVVLAFGFMIFVHELGHFIACRIFGVRVERFALGFGPKIWSRTWGGTEFALLSIPLGGYCRPAGGDLSGESPEKMYEKPPQPGEFLWASWWKRIGIFLAGPFMNYLSAVALLVLLLVVGERIPVEKPLLGFVPPGSLAERAGLQKGDLLLSCNGRAIRNLNTDLAYGVEDVRKGMTFVVERAGKRFEASIRDEWKDPGTLVGLFGSAPPVLGDVHLMTPARKAGLRPGDEVLSIDGKPVSDWMELAWSIRNAASEAVTLQVRRKGGEHTVVVNRIFNGSNMAIGISPPEGKDYDVRKTPLLQAVPAAFQRSAAFSAVFLEALWKLFTLKMSLKDNIAGPITILRTMYQRAAQSWIDFLNTVVMISLILCLMNLLPIPVVDGGQIVLCLLEGIRRSPMSVRFQLVYQQVGMIFIFALMGLAVFNDVWSWVQETFRSQIR
jgi:regulator of sigma E protease